MPARVKVPEGDRSKVAKARIADAVIQVIAEVGLGRLTHRHVAAAAGISLAATTYHYATKLDMVADASSRLLDGYVQSFRQAAGRQRSGTPVATNLAGFAAKLLLNSTGRHRLSSLAWCEIILNAARTEDGHRLARNWFDELFAAWRDLAGAMNVPDAEAELSSTVDVVIGFLFIALPLGLSTEQMGAVLSGKASIAKVWKPIGVAVEATATPLRATKKAQRTRERIVEAAIALLTEGGVGAVTYKAIAQMSGLSIAAPVYYFGSMAALLKCAEATLFELSKERYRDMRATLVTGGSALDAAADLTAAIFVREAAQHGQQAVAIHSLWLEAARQPELRLEIWEALMDQAQAWTHRLARIDPAASLTDGFRAQALYIGKMVRTLATGASIASLAQVRGQFLHELQRGAADLVGGTDF